MFHTAFDSIAAGVLLGELLRRPDTRAKLQNLAANRWILGTAILYPAIVSPLLSHYFEGAYSITVGKTLDFICIGVLLIAAVSQPGTLLFRFLNWRPLAYVGALSYSLYVWNNLFLNGETGWFVNTFPFNLACVFGMGLFSYYLIEKPFLKLKDYFHKPKQSKPIEADKELAAAA